MAGGPLGFGIIGQGGESPAVRFRRNVAFLAVQDLHQAIEFLEEEIPDRPTVATANARVKIESALRRLREIERGKP